jgi:hypothetical protein
VITAGVATRAVTAQRTILMMSAVASGAAPTRTAHLVDTAALAVKTGYAAHTRVPARAAVVLVRLQIDAAVRAVR